jgi:hypothetical protein
MARLLLLVTCGAIVVSIAAALLNGNPPEKEKPMPVVEPFHDQLLDIAKDYKKSLTAVDPVARWAPTFCRAPAPRNPLHAQVSSSKDSDTHGQKLYFLFAKHPMAYVVLADQDSPVGQVLVKESWVPEPFASKGDKLFRGTARGDLFIMFKLDPKTPQSDNGWVYGTVTADGKKVTSAGRVESCMKCHTEAKHDRLFGLPVTAREAK